MNFSKNDKKVGEKFYENNNESNSDQVNTDSSESEYLGVSDRVVDKYSEKIVQTKTFKI